MTASCRNGEHLLIHLFQDKFDRHLMELAEQIYSDDNIKQAHACLDKTRTNQLRLLDAYRSRV